MPKTRKPAERNYCTKKEWRAAQERWSAEAHPESRGASPLVGPLAQRYWKAPFRCVQESTMVVDATGERVLDVRGWGYLTGKGACGLPEDEAEKIQDDLGSSVAAMLNASWPEWPSALPPPESQGQCERSRLATGSIPVSSAQALCREWEHNARMTEEHRARLLKVGDRDDVLYALDLKARIFHLCASDLRREMARASLRQPEENIRSQPHAEDNA